MGRVHLEHQRRLVGGEERPHPAPVECPPAGRQMEVEALGVDPELGPRALAASAEVVVDVKKGDDVEYGLAKPLDRGVALVGDHMRVTDVEAEREPVGAGPPGEPAEVQRNRREWIRPRVERCQVLDRDCDL